MSDRGGAQPARIWRCYATDIVKAAEKVVTYTASMTQAELLGNDMAFDATVRNLEVIGEAARRIPDEVRERHSGIPWGDIVGMRNRLAHAYFSVDADVVWQVVQDDVPSLLATLHLILQESEGE